MNYYKIINNEKLLREFINFLPELDVNETYYVALFARSKYCDKVKLNKTQVKRFISKKEHLYDNIKELEVELDTYKANGIPIPQEALALYITPNPRCLKKTTKLLLKEFINDITNDNINHKFRPQNKVLSTIQKSNSKNRFLTFDFDIPKNINFDDAIENLLLTIATILNFDSYRVVRTRGGVQLIVILEKVKNKYKNTFYNKIISINYLDKEHIPSNSLMPIIGCYQGGFTPYFIK